MLNYIRAELYKALRRRYVYVTLFILLGLEALLMAGDAFHNAHSLPTTFGNAIVMITELGSIGCCVCLLTGDMVFAGQYKNSTLKNEVAFGLSRARIYLGKLIAQILLSMLYLFIMIGFYVGGCAILLPHNGSGWFADSTALTIVGYFLAAGFPLWVGAQAATCMCLFLIQNDIGASCATLGLTMVLHNVVNVAGLLIRGWFGDLLVKSSRYMIGSMLDTTKSVIGDMKFMGMAWLVGLFWLAATTLIGVYGFHKKEIS